MLVLTKMCNKRYELPPQYPDRKDEKVIVEPGTVIVIPVISIHKYFYDMPTKIGTLNTLFFTATQITMRIRKCLIPHGSLARIKINITSMHI